MLVGNKSDRFTEREVGTPEGIALAIELGCGFVEASATRCTNVEEAFYDVVRLMGRKRKQIKTQAMSGQVEKFTQRTVVEQS
jgi:GTPase KRas protein